MMSHEMDARIEDGAMMEKSGCFGFAPFLFYFYFFFSTRQFQEAEWN